MPVYISYSPIGVFAYNEEKKLVNFVLFKKNDIVKCMKDCEKPELSDIEKHLVKGIKEKVIFENKKDGNEHQFPNLAGDILRENLEEIALKTKFVKNSKEFKEIIYSVNRELTIQKTKESFKQDSLIVQAVNTIDELDKNLNVMAMRLREWYGFYSPEISDKLRDNEEFAKYVAEKLQRDEKSIGVDLDKKDMEEIKSYAKTIMGVYEQRKNLERYIELKTKEVVPNIKAIISGMLSARLLSLAGSLEKLAKFPSSTVQILGAEKSMFRFLKGSGTSPKYGVLFGSAYVQKALKENKGKVARILASKLSMAAKVDFYKGKFIGDKLKKDLEERLGK